MPQGTGTKQLPGWLCETDAKGTKVLECTSQQVRTLSGHIPLALRVESVTRLLELIADDALWPLVQVDSVEEGRTVESLKKGPEISGSGTGGDGKPIMLCLLFPSLYLGLTAERGRRG